MDVVTRLAVLGIVALTACARFDVVTANQCGNGIIEDGEDCDRLDGAAGADRCVDCRLQCVPPDPTMECPGGWGCGRDGVCRRATLAFEESSAPVDVAVDDYVVADLDGDPFPDAIGYGPTEVWLARGTPGPGFEVVDRYPRTRGDVLPAIGRVDANATDDLAFSPGPRAVATLISRDGRLVPAPQPWFEITGTVSVTIPIRSQPAATSDDLLVVDVFADQIDVSIQHPSRAPSPSLSIPKPATCSAVTVRLTAADLDADGDDEIVIGCVDATALWIVDVAVGPAPVLVHTLALPVGLLGDPIVGDLDGDTRADVIATMGMSEFSFVDDLAVFHQATPGVFDAAVADDRLGTQIVLAAADLDGDADLDLVSSGGVHLAPAMAIVAAAPVAWRAATTGDLNADGAVDVIGVSDGRIDAWIAGEDGGYALHAVLVDGRYEGLAVGDFDGDRYDDAATLWARDGDLAVELLYGRDSGVFDRTTSAGQVFVVNRGFHAADLVVDGTLLRPDTASELVLGATPQVFVFTGSGARPPIAPLDARIDPALLALGRFDPFGSTEAQLGNDLLIVDAARAGATLVYGTPSRVIDLADVHEFVTDPADPCPLDPPVTVVAPLDGVSGAELIEVSCVSQLAWLTVNGDIDNLGLQWTTGGAPEDPFWFPVSVEVADLDGDVAPDVIVVTDNPAAPIVVYPNAGGPLDGFGTGYLTGIARGNVDDDPALELVTGGEEVRAYDYAGTTPSIVIDPDRAPQELVPWTIPAPGSPRLLDLDHDGVTDLVLGGDQLRVFRQIPHTER